MGGKQKDKEGEHMTSATIEGMSATLSHKTAEASSRLFGGDLELGGRADNQPISIKPTPDQQRENLMSTALESGCNCQSGCLPPICIKRQPQQPQPDAFDVVLPK